LSKFLIKGSVFTKQIEKTVPILVDNHYTI